MIRDKSQQLIELSQRRIALDKYKKNLQGFQGRQTLILAAVATIQPLVVALRAFRQKGIVSFDLIQRTDKLLNIIADAEAKFQENPELILNNESFNGIGLDSSVNGLKTALKEQLIKNWKTYLTQQMPSTNKEMLNLLSEVEAFRPTVQRIQKLDLQLQQIEFPKNREDFERVDQQIDLLRQSWNSLSSDEVPAAVLSFLKAAADQGAPIDFLTPEVQEWLTKHGIANSLRIRLS